MGADLRIIEVLKDFIEVLRDYDENFRRAVERAESSDLKRMVHRTLMELRAALPSDRDRTRGEDGALGNDLPRYIQELLEHQLEHIGISHTPTAGLRAPRVTRILSFSVPADRP